MYRWLVILLLISISFTGCIVKKENVSLQQKRKIENKIESKSENKEDEQTNEENQKVNDITEIQLLFNEESLYWNDSITITNTKIINDIMSMTHESKSLIDESKANKIRETEGENKLIVTQSNGSKDQMTFVFDTLYEIGYIEIEGKKYEPDYSFFRYLIDLNEYTGIDTNIDAKVLDIFNKYAWTVDYKINTIKEKLPDTLKHKAGEYPSKIYWAYNNQLSKDIGFDFTRYLGMDVVVEIYRLREPLPEFMEPRRNARGIVLKYNDAIIGAYIDAGRHESFACSLDRKPLNDITGTNWGKWVADYIDNEDELEIRLSKMTPEDIIKEYFKALNKNDIQLSRACLTREKLSKELSTNLINNYLFNEDNGKKDNNIKKAKLLSVEKMEGMENEEGVLEYCAKVDFDFKEVITSEDGISLRFLILKKETQTGGWRIDSIGTGP